MRTTILIIAALLLLAWPAQADYEDDYRRIDQYAMEEHVWAINLHKREQELADSEAERQRIQEEIDEHQDRLSELVLNQ